MIESRLAMAAYRDGLIRTVRYGLLSEMPNLEECLQNAGQVISVYPEINGQLDELRHEITEAEIRSAWIESEEITREERVRYSEEKTS